MGFLADPGAQGATVDDAYDRIDWYSENHRVGRFTFAHWFADR
jgi:hypothetical protein